MAVNNILNLRGSGIVSFDGIKVFTALAIPLTVANGGTGVASLTAYNVVVQGAGGNFQDVGGVGTAGQALLSQGASAFPIFSDPGGYTLSTVTFSASPSDATTYFLATAQSMTTFTASGNANTRFYIPKAGVIVSCYGTVTVSGTLGSAGSSTLSLRLNNSTDTTVSSSIAMTAADNAFSGTGLNLTVAAGDYIEFKWLTPTWATNPTLVRTAITVYVR